MGKDLYYVTTPIYYVNDVPHIGHCYCTIAADTIARWQRLAGKDVFLLTGTDEHGQKVDKAAQERGVPTQKHIDEMVVPFKNLWKRFNINYNDFIRTTEPRHEKVVQEIFQTLYDNGDIYKGSYEGWYCVHEETFYASSQIKKGKCPECERPVERLKEESYYFKTSKYQEQLLKHIKKNPEFVQPDTRKNEVVSFLEGGVNDVCVSRTTFKWGVPVPFDQDHVVYVWFDALINYISGIGYLQDDTKFNRIWPANVHLLGKDIIKFHAVIWPSMLFALGLELPKQVFATGFWTLEEEKISKSKGIVIDPNKLADEFGVDAVRYFLLREIPLGADGEFTRSALIKRINFDLANDLGNLLHRTLPMMQKYCDGKIPQPRPPVKLEKDLKLAVTGAVKKAAQHMDKLKIRDALAEIWKAIGKGNKYVDEAAPWTLAKEGKTEQLNTVMNSIAENIRIVAILIYPFMPETAQKIWSQLGLKDELAKQTLSNASSWGEIPPNTQIKKGKPLFPRIDT